MPYTPSVVSHTAKPAASGRCTLPLNQKGETWRLISKDFCRTQPGKVLLSHTWIDSFTLSSSPVDTETWLIYFFALKRNFVLHLGLLYPHHYLEIPPEVFVSLCFATGTTKGSVSGEKLRELSAFLCFAALLFLLELCGKCLCSPVQCLFFALG